MLRKPTAALIVAVLTLVACEGGVNDDTSFPVREPAASPTTDTGPVIGLVGTFSGDGAWRGEDAFEGVDVAVQVLNRQRAADEERFTLVGEDDAGNPERSMELLEELITSERTVGIVYAGPPEALAGAEPLLAEAGIPALVVYGDLYSARLLRPHIFQVSPPLLWQARRIATYLLNDRRYERVGLLVEDSLSGDTAGDSMRSALAEFGGTVTRRVSYPEGDEDLSEEIDLLKGAEVETIVFQGTPFAARAMFDELRERDAVYIDTDRARTSTANRRQRRINRGEWRPQVAAFDSIVNPLTGDVPVGTIAGETYARGASYLPIPDFQRFRENYFAWWDEEPIGWQRRSYEATLMIGWAYRNGDGDDLAATLETLTGERLGGLDVSFGPDDHTSVVQTTVGLLVVPRRDLEVRDDVPEGLPWVMLSRGFSTNGERTDVLPADWDALFRGNYRITGPAPRIGRLRFGVATPRRDPVH